MHVHWKAFLDGLERHVRANPWGGQGEDVPPAAAPWHASPPATDAEISALEQRFAVPFPPSYVSFLRAANGLTMASHPVWRFFADTDVAWFRKRHNDWIRAYTATNDPSADRDPPDDEYYGYTDDVRPFFRSKHFRHTLLISAVGDSAVYLLNPQVVWPSGEWEAWFLANWNPGVKRYRSFAELMWEQYGGHTGLTEEQFGLTRETGLPTVYQDPPGKPDRRAKKIRAPKPPRPVGVIARDLRDGDYPTLRKAINELARLRTTEATELLGSVLQTHPAHHVREDVAHALGKVRRAVAVPMLIAALGDEHYGTVAAAANALGNIGDARAVEPLLTLLETWGSLTFYAVASSLAKLKEARAAESIGRFLRSTDPRHTHQAANAGVLLFEFGDVGLRVLLDILDTGDSTAKIRALRGAVYFPVADVEPAVRRIASDPDDAVRAAAAQVLHLLPRMEGAKRG
jgi:hypothetical protein